ncbi:hypothetical protein BA897_04115 [Spiribacter roseus]|nr:hypothetical protein BA897_04115 [Spiribacter roseus]
MKKLCPLALVLTGISGPVLAQQGYVGFSIGSVDVDIEGYPTATPTAFISHFGGEVNEYFSYEFRVGNGIADDDIDVLGSNVDVSLNPFYGAYGIGRLPISDRISFYGLAGYTYGETKFEGPGGVEEESESDLSYGVGGQIGLTDRITGFVEYVQYIDGSDFEVSGISVGGTYRY